MALTLLFAPAALGYDHPAFLRIPLRGPYITLAPGVTDDMLSTEIQSQLFLGLTRIDYKTLKTLPYLAERWEGRNNLKTYRFYLRKDARWTNGDLVTAHEVVWAIRHNILPETRSRVAYFLYVLENGEKIHKGEITNVTRLGVHLIDDFSLEFNLEHPASYFPAMVASPAFWPLPKKTISDHGDRWTAPETIVTNGPYRLRDIWDKKVTVLKANPGFFHADKVRIPEIHYMVIDPERAIPMYRNDELDIVGGETMPIPTETLPWIMKTDGLKQDFTNDPRLCTYYYGFNTQKPPADNYLVRRAISAAIDREVIVDYVTGGKEEPAYTFTRPPIFGSVHPRENVGVRFNPALARKWLAEAGYPDGEGFPGFVLAYNPGELHAKIARAVRKQLQQYLNISITLTELTWDQFEAILFKKYDDAHMFRYGWCADYPDANNFLMEQMHPTKSANLIRWGNELFAALVESARKTNDLSTRKRLYRQAERILCEEDAAIVPVYYYTDSILVKPWIDAKFWPLLGNHVWTWSFKDESWSEY